MEYESNERCNEKLPDVTIVIPTLNSSSTLRDCLESIAQQSYPKEKTKVVIVDGGSKDSTCEIALKFGVAVLSRPGSSRGTACNEGVREATGRIVAFTDADAVVTTDWVSRIVKQMQPEQMLDAIGGLDLGLSDDAPVAKVASATSLLRRTREAYGWKAVNRIRGVNSAYDIRTFREFGGFDGSLTYSHEGELHARMVSLGRKIKYTPDLLVYHRRHGQNWRSLTRSFWISRSTAPLLFRSWMLRSILHDPTSSLATLLYLLASVSISIPLLILVLITGNYYVLVDFTLLTIGVCFLYSTVLIRGTSNTTRKSILVAVMVVLPIQSFLRALGAFVGALEFLGRRIGLLRN